MGRQTFHTSEPHEKSPCKSAEKIDTFAHFAFYTTTRSSIPPVDPFFTFNSAQDKFSPNRVLLLKHAKMAVC